MKIKRTKWDTLWSKMVRERDGRCRRCGKCPPYKLDAHHVMPRSRRATRYLIDNGITLCTHCHTFGDDSIHRVGKKAAIAIVGLKEYKRLEKLSLVTTSDAHAVKRFQEFIDQIKQSYAPHLS